MKKKKKRPPLDRKIIIIPGNADRVNFTHSFFCRLAGLLFFIFLLAFAEQCDCVFDFNFLTISHSVWGTGGDVFFFCESLSPPSIVGLKGCFSQACEGTAGASLAARRCCRRESEREIKRRGLISSTFIISCL